MNNNLDYPYRHDKEFGSAGWARTTDILINSQAQLPAVLPRKTHYLYITMP